MWREDCLIRICDKSKTQWRSCQVIEEGYDELFAALESSVNILSLSVQDIPVKKNELRYLQETKRVKFFIESQGLSLSQVVTELTDILGKSLSFIVPIYGNMTDRTQEWIAAGEVLRKHHVTLVCSSSSLAEQTRFFTDSEIQTIPYPITSDFYHSSRREISKKIRLVYAGRLSLGKNVLQLLQTFLKASLVNEELELSVCGWFSGEGHHFHGFTTKEEDYLDEFHRLIDLSKGKIKYLGNLSQTDLRKVWSESDYFISLSTYHDEDFGVAAAQAQASGAGLILSAWGGHLDFDGAVIRIPLTHSPDGILRPRLDILLEKLLQLRSLPERNESRGKRFSVSSLTKKWSDLIVSEVQPFRPLSELYLEYAALFEHERGSPYRRISSDSRVKEIFKKLYTSYCGSPNPLK